MREICWLIIALCLGLARPAQAQAPSLDAIMHDGTVRLLFPGGAQVDGSGNPGLAPTYLGKPLFDVAGLIRGPSVHVNLSGYTRGWADGTCLLAVNANPPPGQYPNGCGQGGFWDASYRAVYPGQDSDAASFGIAGIVPVGRDLPVARFATMALTNPAGEPQTVAAVVLATPLDPAQVAAINAADGPMRVQVNNGFFGYTLPKGMTLGSNAVPPASDDGRTVLVDNWTRAITPGNGAAAGTEGGTATHPSLAYVGGGGRVNAGTGLMPDQVGATNGSAALPRYTVTIDGNYLIEDFYVGFKTDDHDVVNNTRIMEFVGVNNKTGHSEWDELEPLGDRLNGEPMASQIFFGGCQNDDGKGVGSCGVFAYVGGGLKRGMACANAQTTIDIGATDCVLDTQSTFGWKSVKASGYVLWVDPKNTGHPKLVVDAAGNMNDENRIFVGAGNSGVTVSPDGSVTASGTVTSGGWAMKAPSGVQTGHTDQNTGTVMLNTGVAPGQFMVASQPGCDATHAGLMVYFKDALKPGERHGVGSGAPGVCDTASRGSRFQWNSVYDHVAVRS